MRRALLSAAVVVVLDQLTKIWAVARLADEPGQRIELGAGAQFQLHYNTGAAFSSGTNFGQLIGVVAIGMSILLLRLASQRSDRFGQIILGVIAGGAIGNLADRIFRADDGPLSGAVVDFIRPLDFFAIFNVADAAIFVGVIGVLGQGLLFPPVEEENSDGSGTLSGPDDEHEPEEANLESAVGADDSSETEFSHDDGNGLDRHEDSSDESLPSV